MDKLEQIMDKQAELQKRLGTDFSTMSLEERAEYMRNHRGYLADEIAEALYEMPNYKLWKDYSGMSEGDTHRAWQKVRMELIDSLHFFVNLLLCAGMTADEVYEMYMAKNKENHRRQDEGYTADKSYREQAVEDVMEETDDSACTVYMDGEAFQSDEFVTVLVDKDKGAHLFFNTDVLTLGQAIQMLARRYEQLMSECPEDVRTEVREALTHG